MDYYNPTPEQSYAYQDPGFGYTQTTIYQDKPKRNMLPILLLVALGVLLLGVLLFLLLGGGGKSNNNNTNTGIDPNRKVELIWWGVFMSPDVVQPLIDEYQALNPNVTILYANRWPDGDFVTAGDSYRSELNRVLTGEDPVEIPDIYMIHNTWAGDYEKYSRPSSVHSFSTFESTFHPAVVEDFAHNKQAVYGVPLGMDTLAILYNKDMLEQTTIATPPTRWTPEFVDLVKKLTIKNGNTVERSGFAAGTGDNVSFSAEILYLLLAQNGVSMLNANNQASFSTDSDTLGALTFYKEFASNNVGGWNSNFKNDAAAFLEKDVAMIVATSWRYRSILEYNEQYDIGLDIGVSQIPQLDGQDQPLINWADYWANMVALNRPNGDVAWNFLKWISEPEQLRKLHANEKERNTYFGMLYPRKDMITELQDDPYLTIFNESLPYAKTWYQVKGSEVRKLFKELINGSGTAQGDIASIENDVQLLLNNKGVLE